MRAVVTAGTVGILAAAALAGGVSSPLVSHGALQRLSGGTATLQQSTNWSGIAVTKGGYTRVTGSWSVPTVKVTSGNRYAADWVGIGGFNTQDLIQAGIAENSVGGHATYWAWTEELPAPSAKIAKFPVHAGDAITVDIDQVSTASWTITVTDFTSGLVATTKNIHYISTNSSAEWIHEAPTINGTQARLATTTTVDFDHGTVNGSTAIGKAGSRTAIQLVGPTDATPSALDSDGDGFAVADGAKAPPAPPS